MAKKERVFAVFGMGSFGSEICRVLSEKGGKVLAFDNQPLPLERVRELASQVLILDSTDEEALRAAPLGSVDVAVVAIGEDVEASILTTALLKKAGVPFIVARAVSDIHARVLHQIGANEVVNLELEEGRRVASRLLSTEALETVPISGDFSLVEMRVPSAMAGRSLDKLNVREGFRVNVVAVERFSTTVDREGNPVQEERVVLPSREEVLHADDIIVVVGRNADIEALREQA